MKNKLSSNNGLKYLLTSPGKHKQAKNATIENISTIFSFAIKLLKGLGLHYIF
jgi:hypothetical protein